MQLEESEKRAEGLEKQNSDLDKTIVCIIFSSRYLSPALSLILSRSLMYCPQQLLQKNIRERDEAISQNERRIFQLKQQNHELEKFKFVLDYKIKELREEMGIHLHIVCLAVSSLTSGISCA